MSLYFGDCSSISQKYKLTGKVKAVLQEDGFSTLFSKLVANGIVSEEVVVACRSIHIFLPRLTQTKYSQMAKVFYKCTEYVLIPQILIENNSNGSNTISSNIERS